MSWTAGRRVTVAETDPVTMARVPDGEVREGVAASTEGLYVLVRYDDPALNAGQPDRFWASSGWRAYDNSLRWMLEDAQRTGGQPFPHLREIL